jgi:hypothetical protein
MRSFSWDRLWRRSPVQSPARTKPRYRPCLEILETRQLLSTFSVVLATDSGGPGGQMVTPTSGDLRYCIGQADAAHSTASDTITFDPTLFATPQTITLNRGTGPLVLSDSVPLTIQGPTGRTATVSGGDAIQVLSITGGTVSISNLAISHGNTPLADGGGISNGGTLTLTSCTLDHDVGDVGGGLVNFATAKLIGCTLTHDTAIDAGGIDSSGKLTLTNCNLSNDSASGVGGGGLWIDYGATATITGTMFNNDSAPGEDGGGVFIVGNSNTPSKGTFTNCTFTNDSAFNGGGGLCTDGICTVNMTKCNISNDTAGQGGGVCNSGATVVLSQCSLSNDSESGFLNEGTATVTACAFSNNTCTDGGGMENLGAATVTNCTFSNNTATNGGDAGGAIVNGPSNDAFFTLNVINCTIADNSAVNGSGGGIDNIAGSTLNLYNTIVAENTAAKSGPDISGSINIADHNLIGDGGGSTIVTDQGGNLVGGNGNPVIDPRLGPLQNNGGPTQTVALFADSPAIGHADNAKAPTTDQRGHNRLDQVGEVTDIGAYESP